MRDILRAWIADTDTRHAVENIGVGEMPASLVYQEGRYIDLYVSLVGELFELIRNGGVDHRDWATIGSGLALVGDQLSDATRSEAYFFSAVSYYMGGFSASAYLTMRRVDLQYLSMDSYLACYDLLARPEQTVSRLVGELIEALRNGVSDVIAEIRDASSRAVGSALLVGADDWISANVLSSLLGRFVDVNVRAGLPDGYADRWTPLVRSFLDRSPPVWDFFPSQLEALSAGLLTSNRTFSLQMLTGAGKTALTETLIYNHLVDSTEALAVLLVPFRSLAQELRGTLGRTLSGVGLPARTVYGGTVPSSEEADDLDNVRIIIATPEALMGLLDSAPDLLSRLSLVVCDEGHLLDSPGRGVGLELLLSRFLNQETVPRMVFSSAIVPNVEEVNSWLGGGDETVIQSVFRPTDVEYAVLRPNGATGRKRRVALELKPPAATTLPRRTVPDFLAVTDFEYFYESTGRTRTWSYDSVKAQAVAAARKYLPLGTVAVFSTTKSGNEGIESLAGELLGQLDRRIQLPAPTEFITDKDAPTIVDTVEYLRDEYGDRWIGTRALNAGAVVHHGDIPQETREVFEELLRSKRIRMVFCTSTLAEGVNLPVRTLVLYSTQRRMQDGTPIPMPARDIRNLVGRAGRAGSTTTGLVICANQNQWGSVVNIAEGAPGEPVVGALRSLIERLADTLEVNDRRLSNPTLEVSQDLFPLVDGVDSTLIELMHDELGPDEVQRAAATIAERTYAYQQVEQTAQELLESIFALRAVRLVDLRDSGRLAWAVGSGAKPRLLDSVNDQLLPSFERWDTVESAFDRELIDAVIDWAWHRPELERAVREAYPDRELDPITRMPDRHGFGEQVRLWIEGRNIAGIAEATERDVELILRIHSGVIAYTLTMLVEQAVAIIERRLADDGVAVAEAVALLADYIRHGVNTPFARNLVVNGVRHRRAALLLGANAEMSSGENSMSEPVEIASALIDAEPGYWRSILGNLVLERTARDLGVDLRDSPRE